MHPVEIPRLSARGIDRFWAIADRCKRLHRRKHGELCRSCQHAWDREWARVSGTKQTHERKTHELSTV